MDIYEACMIVDGVIEANEDHRIEAWQVLIDSGVVWTLPGTYGRMARDLIQEGICNLRA